MAPSIALAYGPLAEWLHSTEPGSAPLESPPPARCHAIRSLRTWTVMPGSLVDSSEASSDQISVSGQKGPIYGESRFGPTGFSFLKSRRLKV